MIGGHNKNVVCHGQRWFFFFLIYLFDNPIVTMGREIWILNVHVENTKKCQLNYNTFDDISEN